MPPDQLRQLAQAFANCNQTLSHRGFVSLQGTPFSQSNGMVSLQNGDLPPWASGNQSGNGQAFSPGQYGFTYYGGNYYGEGGPSSTFNNFFSGGNTYNNAFNSTPVQLSVDNRSFEFPPVGGGYTSNWTTYQGDSNFFDFADRSEVNTNYFFGGPTFQVAGDSYFDNSQVQNLYSQTLTVQEVNAAELNGESLESDQADPAFAGPGGPPGAPGNPAAAGPAGAAGAAGPPGAAGLPFFLIAGGGAGGGGGININPPVDLRPLADALQRLLNARDALLRKNIRRIATEMIRKSCWELGDDCCITVKTPNPEPEATLPRNDCCP